MLLHWTNGNPIDAELDYSIADTNVAMVDSEGNIIANDYVEGGIALL